MKLQIVKLAAFAMPLCILAACTGSIGEDDRMQLGGHGAHGPGTGTGTGTDTTGGGGDGNGGGGGVMLPPADCNNVEAPALHARMLSPSQYDNTVLDVLKIGGNPAKEFSAGAELRLDDPVLSSGPMRPRPSRIKLPRRWPRGRPAFLPRSPRRRASRSSSIGFRAACVSSSLDRRSQDRLHEALRRWQGREGFRRPAWSGS